MASTSDWTRSTTSRQLLVRFAGDITEETAPHLRRALGRALPGPDGRVLVDLSGVQAMDCTGLGVLVEAKARLGERLWFRGVTPQVRDLLRVTGLLESLGVAQDAGLTTSDASAGRVDPLVPPAERQHRFVAGLPPATRPTPAPDLGSVAQCVVPGPTRNDQAARIVAEAYGCDAEAAWQMLFRASRIHAVQVHELTHHLVEAAWGQRRVDPTNSAAVAAVEGLLPPAPTDHVSGPREGPDDSDAESPA